MTPEEFATEALNRPPRVRRKPRVRRFWLDLNALLESEALCVVLAGAVAAGVAVVLLVQGAGLP